MDDLPATILASKLPDGSALPSVRSLARHFGVAPLTVHRALGRLRDQGHVHAVPRKGFFWGKRPIPPERIPPREDRRSAIRERFVSDLRCGTFHPHRDLPPREALAQLYGIGPRSLGGLLESLSDEGILVRRGRGFAMPSPPPLAAQGTVLLATRCDRHGALLLETERQTDFVKSVHREGRERGLRIVVAGWHEDGRGGLFLDQAGCSVDIEAVPGLLLGCLASTWLVREPTALLSRLVAARTPVSVWWEHPPGEFPRHLAKTGLMGFDISFGPSPGIAVGRHLRACGAGPVAFVSPFHAASWSIARCEGLREGLRGSGIEVEEIVEAQCASAHEFHQAAGGVAAGERRLGRVLDGLLDRLDPGRHPAWVVVNDHVATILLHRLRKRGGRRPRILSFDNSSASDALQFDSFEFHTDGMVRQMLYHVLHPKARLFRAGGLHEMVGRLVLRT